jgi:hypothetical protein
VIASQVVTRPQKRLFFSLLVILAACGALACAGSKGQGAKSAHGQVVERAEGFSERPAWADPNSPFSRSGDSVRVLGYVSIPAEQRKEAGFRAADSYARAELVRFLSTRIVAVLTDKISTEESGQISEIISETAGLLVDDLVIFARYWEKVKDSEGLKWHLYSRVDVDKQLVAQLLAAVWEKNGDLRTPLASVQLAVNEGWDTLAQVDTAGSAADLLPSGIYTPTWAKGGDSESTDEFRFVCHGLAADEAHARALARRMCSEKLCRLFGVQIKSETRVTETLEGIDVESEVTEGCLDVRVEGRKTDFRGGECGPRGCVQWIQQSYPKSAYLEERKRLSNPTVVERQVVIQEGDIKYKDPAVCEAELRKYGSITDRGYADIVQRIEILKKARAACQGIDGRDSGLFNRLWHLLQNPLGTFVHSSRGHRQRVEDYFLYASAQWLEELSTERFFDQRIFMVIQLLENARAPIFAVDTMKRVPQDLVAIQKAMKSLYLFPYENRPIAATHSVNVHYIHQHRPKGQKDAEFLGFLVRQARERSYNCDWATWINGSILIAQIQSHGTGTAAEWQTELHILKNANASRSTCAHYMLKNPPSRARLLANARDIIRLVKDGTISLPEFSERKPASQLESLKSLIGGDPFTAQERLELVLEWEGALQGSTEDRMKLAEITLRAFEPKHQERNASSCGDYVSAAQTLSARFSYFGFEKYSDSVLCECLNGGLSGASREQVVRGLSAHAQRVCKWIKDDEWPGGMGVRPSAPEPPSGAVEPPGRSRDEGIKPGAPANPWDVASILSAPIKKCLMNTEVRQPYNGVLSAYVQVTAQASSAGLSRVGADVRVTSLPKDLQFEKRSGWVTQTDIRRTEQTVQACIEKAAEELRPSQGSALASAGSSRVWLLFSSADVYKALWLR